MRGFIANIVIAGLLLAAPGCKQRKRVETIPHAKAESPVREQFSTLDSAQDGTPDFLRLDREQDRVSFRRWFTFLAEEQYFHQAESRAPEITDCASLLRYCYREALVRHDSRWASGSGLQLIPALRSVQKYSYPYTPLGAALFRVREGVFEPGDETSGAFAQFANARTLEQLNSFFVSRSMRQAQPGDLLFFRSGHEGNGSFHSMIYVGRSQIQPSPELYVVYDSGPEGGQRGEMRRLRVSDLERFPDPQWRPTASNEQFLGVFRWNILRDIT